MESQKRRDWFSILGSIVIGLLTINSLSPLDYALSREIASNTVNFLFIFLGVGTLSFFLKKHYLMLSSFVACISLCHFMKEAQSNEFAYSCPSQDTQVTIAHITLDQENSSEIAIEKIKEVNAELIAIQVPQHKQAGQILDHFFAKTHPHFQKISHNKGSDILIYSKYPVSNLDTVYYNGNTNLAGSIFIDSTHGKLDFITGYLTEDQSDNSYAEVKNQLASLSRHIGEDNTQPLLAIGATRLASWSPEIQEFKTEHELNGSRRDLEFGYTDEYIFYSNHLECVKFDYVLDGKGVLGIYQFKEKEEKAAPAYHTSVSINKAVISALY